MLHGYVAVQVNGVEVLRRTPEASLAAAWQKAQALRVKAGEPAVTPSKAPGSFWVLGTPSVEVVS
jgi:hypothetical protein